MAKQRKELVTVEEDPSGWTVTILDDTGRENELEIMYAKGGDQVFIRQHHENASTDIISLSPAQADLVCRSLSALLGYDLEASDVH